MLKVSDVYSFIDSFAPYSTQEEFDNSGLNVGKANRDVSKILVALDVTESVVDEAKKIGAELIVSHHPLLFHARKDLTEDDPEGRILCELVRAKISVISAHTNLDLSDRSGSACIARKLKLANIHTDGYLYLGDLDKEQSAVQLAKEMERILKVPIRIYGNLEKKIKTVAVAGGAYDIGYSQAIKAGAQALLTGEVRHHNALAASMDDFVLMDGTHFATESILVPELTDALQNADCVIKSKVLVFASEVDVFPSVRFKEALL